jgi:uncharacterized membrane protein YraQ (UPF0718 family)
MKRSRGIQLGAIALYLVFLLGSYAGGFAPGQQIGRHFLSFLTVMLQILPCVFILICLFEVWVKRETIERHLGEDCGIGGYLWALLLAGSTVGGVYVAFPVAAALHHKGAKLSVIFTYIGGAAICRAPMTLFEASFLGLKFTAIRLLISVPLLVGSSIILGRYLKTQNYRILQHD